MRIRSAGVLMLGRKTKLSVVASKLAVSGQSVYNWASVWRDSGVCS
jgi:hypothetical protein